MTQASGAKAENTIVRPAGFTQPSNSMDVPRAGASHRFVRPLVIDEETVVTFRYKRR